jgi:integrase/recombinase XerD
LRRHVRKGPDKVRNEAIVLLSIKAGLRAAEIAGLTWPMIMTPDGDLGSAIELLDCAAKKGSGRTIPLHPDLRKVLLKLMRDIDLRGPVICSGRGGAMRPHSIVRWFERRYRELKLAGCSSHSGRRTFITRAARKIHLVGGSLRDVQQLAGHRSIEHTQRYIEGDTLAKRRLVTLI